MSCVLLWCRTQSKVSKPVKLALSLCVCEGDALVCVCVCAPRVCENEISTELQEAFFGKTFLILLLLNPQHLLLPSLLHIKITWWLQALVIIIVKCQVLFFVWGVGTTCGAVDSMSTKMSLISSFYPPQAPFDRHLISFITTTMAGSHFTQWWLLLFLFEMHLNRTLSLD